MSLHSSGSIFAHQINQELGRAWDAPFSLDGGQERGLAGKSGGAISFADFFGKALREPAEGWHFSHQWNDWTSGKGSNIAMGTRIYWNGQAVLWMPNNHPTVVKVGEWTYYRGWFQYSGYNIEHYSIARMKI